MDKIKTELKMNQLNGAEVDFWVFIWDEQQLESLAWKQEIKFTADFKVWLQTSTQKTKTDQLDGSGATKQKWRITFPWKKNSGRV